MVACGHVSWRRGRSQAGFEMMAHPTPIAEWQLLQLTWLTEVPGFLRSGQVNQMLINGLDRLLLRTNMWPEQSAGGGAKIVLNQRQAPDPSSVCASFRFGALDVPAPQWSAMWSRIESRLRHDPFLSAQGFSRQNMTSAVLALQSVFPYEWVRRRYQDAEDAGMATMRDPLPKGSTFWFPAYHLARLAIGAMCTDPGLNCLIELGLTVQNLARFSELPMLLRQLARSSGVLHHICLAGDLHSRGMLTGLEPASGSGSSKSDLLAQAAGEEHEVEVKAFTSQSPGKRLQSEAEHKATTLPKDPGRPMILYAVLIEEESFDKERESRFVQDGTAIAEGLSPNISGIATGAMFMDASGGRLKRHLSAYTPNPRALRPADESSVRQIFQQNYDAIAYPQFGVSSFLSMEKGSK